ncbi:CMRF35-like molecule 5 isoform X2 [Puntigrus tetrazona]|uniref:CMRF35-like molecule 5 isoform X2 n=1 Tax=Puntigrus tetrazona TaxID=1606681 RepID=UPI001C890109|nr:CMRF35-like molecule 5 isoform X2 [Puntigrus tetrazona]
MFRMCFTLFIFSSIFTVVAGSPKTVTGYRGHRLDIRCSYEAGYESNSKYFCKGECIYGFRNIVVESGSPAKDERFSLTDDKSRRVFTVSISDLRPEDEGQYWCVVERSSFDVYSEILLQVKRDNKTTEVSTVGSFSITPSYFSTTEQKQHSTSITITERRETSTDQIFWTETVIYVSVGFFIVMILFLTALTVLCRKTRKKSTRATQSGLSQQVSVLLPLNEHTAEDIDCNNHSYEEINKLRNKREDISTFYTTADSPDDPSIYSAANEPNDSTIYSTANEPNDSTIYSTANEPNDSTIYSTANEPNDSTIRHLY